MPKDIYIYTKTIKHNPFNNPKINALWDEAIKIHKANLIEKERLKIEKK